ncbi:acyltransferase [Granulicella sp. L60]|uniref:acyltransferase family protein n=1 Tax=Granulicella sp. L60 TaxID=1641866 RepID=UPI00131D0C40|nr:acyltransferase [Granulicella sp. L60]
MGKSSREYFPSLEGIRGYAFLLIFLIHYTEVYKRPSHLALYPLYLLQNTAWFLVPIFFVLSGFLITRILLYTREREGYFRVFYLRRAVRIFPLYYLTILPIGLFGLLRHWPLQPAHLLYLVDLQNFSHIGWNFSRYVLSHVTMVHLWSLAVEEQFYLVWPLIIWMIPTEKLLLRVSYGVIAFCFLFRLAWPLTHLPYDGAYFYTTTRVDAIIIGAILAVYHGRVGLWERLAKVSRILIPVAWGIMIALTIVRGTGLTTDYFGVAFSIPMMNLIGTAFVILALHPGSIVQRVCSGNLICRFGRLTYALYLFHLLYAHTFTQVFAGKLDRYLPHVLSEALMISAAFAFTLLLAMLAYRFIELPAMSWKDKFVYGPRSSREVVPTEVTVEDGLPGLGHALLLRSE